MGASLFFFFSVVVVVGLFFCFVFRFFFSRCSFRVLGRFVLKIQTSGWFWILDGTAASDTWKNELLFKKKKIKKKNQYKEYIFLLKPGG